MRHPWRAIFMVISGSNSKRSERMDTPFKTSVRICWRRCSRPDLSQAGWKFSREHLRQQILNPRAGNPDSRMPVFEGKISEEDLAALVEYLSLML